MASGGEYEACSSTNSLGNVLPDWIPSGMGRLGNTWSDGIYAYWREREGASYKRQTRPTAWTWEGGTSDQYQRRGRHEQGVSPSTRGQRGGIPNDGEEGRLRGL